MVRQNESVWQRAWRDTDHFRQSSWFFWGAEVMGGAVFAFLGSLSLPSQSSKIESALYPAVGFIVGFLLVGLLIYGWNLFRAPYRQRDESRRECDKVQRDLQKHFESIAHTLEVREIVPNWPPDRIGGLGIIIRLRNRAEKPIQYQVQSLGVLIDNTNAKGIALLNNGGVIYGEIEFIIPVLFSDMNRLGSHRGLVNSTILYGLPGDRARRQLNVSATIPFKDQSTTFYWNTRDECAVDMPFTNEQPTWQSILGIAPNQPGATL